MNKLLKTILCLLLALLICACSSEPVTEETNTIEDTNLKVIEETVNEESQEEANACATGVLLSKVTIKRIPYVNGEPQDEMWQEINVSYEFDDNNRVTMLIIEDSGKGTGFSVIGNSRNEVTYNDDGTFTITYHDEYYGDYKITYNDKMLPVAYNGWSLGEEINSEFSYVYDNEGKIVYYTNDSGNEYAFAYDDLARLSIIKSIGDDWVQEFTYEDDSPLKQTHYQGDSEYGMTITYTYLNAKESFPFHYSQIYLTDDVYARYYSPYALKQLKEEYQEHGEVLTIWEYDFEYDRCGETVE